VVLARLPPFFVISILSIAAAPIQAREMAPLRQATDKIGDGTFEWRFNASPVLRSGAMNHAGCGSQ
jgi:hypothetical protein